MGTVVVPTASGFHVELVPVVDERRQRNTFEVGRDGTLSGPAYEVLADGLALPVVR